MASCGAENKDIWLSHVGTDVSEDGVEFLRIVYRGGKGVNLGFMVFLRDLLLGFFQQLGPARQDDDVGRSRSRESCDYSIANALTTACDQDSFSLG